MINYDPTFWALISTVITVPPYTASNGIKIATSPTASDISNYIDTNTITISTANNVTEIIFASNTLRDAAYYAIVSALKEFVRYVKNNGTYTHVCMNCINYHVPNPQVWCRWIVEVAPNFNATIDNCSHFNQLYSLDAIQEFFDI